MILVKISGFHLNLPFTFFQGGHINQQWGQVGGHHFGPHRSVRFHEPMNIHAFIFPLTMLIITKIGLALIGVAIWKFSQGKFGKVLGALLFSFAIYSILPNLLGIPFLFVMAYLGYKAYQRDANRRFNPIATGEFTAAQHYHPRDFLDEWEQSVRKEEQ